MFEGEWRIRIYARILAQVSSKRLCFGQAKVEEGMPSCSASRWYARKVIGTIKARQTCCSGILSLRADFKSLAVLRPLDALSKHVPKDVPESALMLLKSDDPLILPVTPESR